MLDLFELDKSKMAVFGQWLTEQTVQQEAMLKSTCCNIKLPVDAIRMKYGAWEAYAHILKAFTELFQGELKDFQKNYLELTEDNDTDESKQSGT